LYKTLAAFFYRLLKRVSSIDIPLDAGEFRLLDRKVINFMRNLTERSRFMRGLTVWPGLRQAKIQIERAARLSGETNYNFRRSFLVAVDGLVSFSVVPLRLIALCTALGQPEGMRPLLSIVDEPELGLHPASLELFAELMRSAATKALIVHRRGRRKARASPSRIPSPSW